MTNSQAVNSRVGADLTEGSIVSKLIVFAFPIILTSLVQQLYSMVDLVIIGHYAGNTGTVGVNTGGEMADMILPFAMGFSTAGQIFIAQLVGARQEQRLRRTVGTLLSFMAVLSAAFGAAVILFHRQILSLCPAEAVFPASAYMIITALGFPFVFGYNAVVGILRGMGESKRPLLFVLIAAGVNIILDILLVAVIPLGAAGTAIATVASQIGAFGAAFLFMWKARDRFGFELKLSYFKMDGDILKVLIRLGIPQVVRSMFVRIGMLWVNASANSFGLLVSTTNSVGNKIQKFLEVFVQGLDAAGASRCKKDRAGGKDHALYSADGACVCMLFNTAGDFLSQTNLRTVHEGWRCHQYGRHIPADHDRALFCIGCYSFISDYGYRFRLCGAWLCPRTA